MANPRPRTNQSQANCVTTRRSSSADTAAALETQLQCTLAESVGLEANHARTPVKRGSNNNNNNKNNNKTPKLLTRSTARPFQPGNLPHDASTQEAAAGMTDPSSSHSSPVRARTRNKRRSSAGSKVTKSSKASSPASARRRSKFIEETMRNRVSRVPPREYMGEEDGETQDSARERLEMGVRGISTPKPAATAEDAPKRAGVAKRLANLAAPWKFGRGQNQDENRRSWSPLKAVHEFGDLQMKGQKAYEKLKADGHKGTAKTGQTKDGRESRSESPTKPADNPLKAASSTSLVTPNKQQPKTTPLKEVSKSKSYFNLSPTKKGGESKEDPTLRTRKSQKKLLKREKLKKEIQKEKDQLAKHQQELEKLELESSETDLPVISPDNNSRASVGRPLPTVPDKSVSRSGNRSKKLPPPPSKQTLRRQVQSKNDADSRKRKANPTTIDYGNLDEYTRAVLAYDNEADGDYTAQVSVPSSDTPAPSDIHPRSQPVRRAKLPKKDDAEGAAEGGRGGGPYIAPRRSSRVRQTRSAHFITATPGVDGVPPLPRRGSMSPMKEDDVEEDAVQGNDEKFEWPRGIF